MKLVGSRGQQLRDFLYDASGTIAEGGVAQLLLPEHKSRSFLFVQNLHASADMYIEFGAARATVTVSGGQIASFTVTNAGMLYTYPPDVQLIGGGNGGNSQILGVGAPGYPSPGDPGYTAAHSNMTGQRPAKAHAVLSGSAGARTVTSFEIEDPGAGYVIAPMVLMTNNLLDPYGVAVPSVGVGMLLPAGGSNLWTNGTVCPTDAISIFCATIDAPFCCKYSE
jgi:hypothetical protein